jgi:predicted O-linked N-acetylglucosamine transferase (SPINDLY family)
MEASGIQIAFERALQDHQSGRLEKAASIYREILSVDPKHADSIHLLGVIAGQNRRYVESVTLIRQALALSPDNVDYLINLGHALTIMGRIGEGFACTARALSLQPDMPDAHSSVLYNLNFHPGMSPEDLFRQAQHWNRQHAERLPRYAWPDDRDRDANRRLRIGYVSPDFRSHAVTRFLSPLLENYDRHFAEVFCYSDVRRAGQPDEVTERLSKACAQWREIDALSDEAVALRIHEDRIDILVDLSGHTTHNRLLVFARKPAPIQVSYLGYPATTGLTAIDYRLTDALADPPGLTERYHSEQLLRLPDCAWCYRPSSAAPAVADSPAAGSGTVTFGSFNIFPKLNERVLQLWAGVLRAVPGSKLLLKTSALADAELCASLLEFFKNRGVDADRLELLPRTENYVDHLNLYSRVDIALDPFPYHGTTTTCDAMWMGVPVVALAGGIHAMRVGVSLLNAAGLLHLVADTPEGYIRIAADLASDLPRLNALRPGMRERLRNSALTNSTKLARNIEAAYRQMWKTYCRA